MSDLFRAYEKRLESMRFPNRPATVEHFYPTKWFTLCAVKCGVHMVLESRAWCVSAGDSRIENSYMLISHGLFSHQYSLLDINETRRGSVDIGKPLAVYTSPSKYITRGTILDLTFSYGQPAQEIDLVLPPSAYSQGHVEFCACEDYRYEWRYEDVEQTGIHAYHLWRHRNVDGQLVLVGRISPALFLSPVDDSALWTLELDTDRLCPEIAILSGFMVKRLKPFPTFTHMIPPIPRLAVNLAFEDEGVVIQRESKYFADWEDEAGIETKVRVRVIKVYNPAYLASFYIPKDVLLYLEAESIVRARNIRDFYGTALAW